MARDRAVGDVRRSVPDRDGVDDDAASAAVRVRPLWAADRRPPAQVGRQLALQHAPALHEETPVLRRRAGRLGRLLLLIAPTAVHAQPDVDSGEVARTSWNEPDLQGVWSFWMFTPLEREEKFSDAGRH